MAVTPGMPSRIVPLLVPSSMVPSEWTMFRLRALMPSSVYSGTRQTVKVRAVSHTAQ